MAKPEQCSECTKPATIHLTQIINNKIHKVDLCDECPYKEGVTEAEGFSLADFLIKQQPDALIGQASVKCDTCGFTLDKFKKSGRFGCPDCYEAFDEFIRPMLKNMHKDVVHRGKVPSRALARISRARKLESLEQALKDAIETEDYEEAASLRDQIVAARSNPGEE
jgi:protein arginine kinase activator